ncbi:MAG TPA: phage tail tape measure protein, partial [Anaerolineae bacterium]|nr:phage tail tape measure protein [Anaerolineae bacterium]
MGTDLKMALVLQLRNELTAGLKTVNGELRGLQKEVKQVQADFAAQWGEVAQLSKRAGIAIAGAGLAIVGSLGAAAKAASDFNARLAEVSTLVDTSTVKMDVLKNGINSLAMETGQSATALTGGLYQAISAGIEAGSSIEFLGIAAKAAVGGVTDTETAVNGLTTVINAFSLSTQDAGTVADSMFTTVVGGKINFQQLSEAMAQVAPIAASMGVSFSEVNAAFAAMTSQG